MAEPNAQATDQGLRILRAPDGGYVGVKPEDAERLLTQGVAGRLYQDVSQQEFDQYQAKKAAADRPLETFGRSLAEGAAGFASSLIPESSLGKAALGVALPPLGIGMLGAGSLQAATGINPGDSSRSIPGQVAGVLGGAEKEAAYNQETRALREANPTAATLGQLGGELLAGAAVAPGASAAADAIAKRLVASGLRPTLARMLGAAAAEGAANVPFGLTDAQIEARDAGQNDGATGEQLFAAGMLSSILGGVTAAGGVGIASMFSSAAAKVSGKVRSALGKEAAEGVTEAVPKAESRIAARVEREADATPNPFEKLDQSEKAQAGRVWGYLTEMQHAATGAPRETLELFGSSAAEGANMRRIVEHADEARELTEASLGKAVRELEDGVTAYRQHAGVQELKAADFRPHMNNSETTRATGIAQARELSAQIDQDSAEIAAKYSGVPSKKTQVGIARQVEVMQMQRRSLDEAVARAADGGDAADVFAALNAAKQNIGRARMNLIAAAPVDPLVREAHGAVAQAMDRQYMSVMGLLEDQNTWGKAGELQKRINRPAHDMLENNDFYHRSFLETASRPDWDGFRKSTVMPEKVKSFVARLGEFGTTPAEDPVVNAVMQRAQSAGDVMAAYRELLGPGHSVAPTLARAEQASKEAREAIDKAVYTASVVKRFERELMAPEQRAAGLQGLLPSPAILGMAGMALGGPALGVAGMVAGAALRPASLTMARARLSDLAERFVGTRMAARAKDTVGKGTSLFGAVKTAATGARAVGRAAATTGRAAKRVAVPVATLAFIGPYKNLDDAGEKRRDQLNQALANPATVLASVQKQVGSMNDYAPGVAAATLDTTMRALTHLRQTAPVAYTLGGPLTPSLKTATPKSELMRWAKVWQTINNPGTVFEEIAKNTLIPEQVRALQAVYPQLYQRVSQMALTEIADRARRGDRLIPAAAAQWDILLNLGGAGIPALSSEMAVKIDSFRAAQTEKQQQQQSGAPRLASSVALPQSRWPSQRTG